MEWTAQPDCQGAILEDFLHPAAIGSTGGSWIVPELAIRAPDGSASALLTLLAVTSEESGEVRWDEVRFAEVPALVFADGFESGGTASWSNQVP